MSLLVMRGLPGSGKSTRARAWVAEEPERRFRVNRDALRDMLRPGDVATDTALERSTTLAHAATLASLLAAGRDVVVDDTNLRARHLRDVLALAAAAGVDWQVDDGSLEVDVDECVRRDAGRPTPADLGRRDGAQVGEAVIRDLHGKYLARGRRLPVPTPAEVIAAAGTVGTTGTVGAAPGTTGTVGAAPGRPYVPPPGGEPAVMVDLDGTLARMRDRSPYDWARVGEDDLVETVADTVRLYHEHGHRVIVMSGRDGSCEDATRAWLATHAVPYDTLHLRPAGDRRKDSVVKRELFDAHVRDRYDVRLVLDDRDQVVRAWRGIGLTCYQVAPGDF